MAKTLLESEEYYLKLYRKMLRNIEDCDCESKLNFPKWQRDVLLVLLCRAKPKVKRKLLRKRVASDLGRIMDDAWEELEKEGAE